MKVYTEVVNSTSDLEINKISKKTSFINHRVTIISGLHGRANEQFKRIAQVCF